MPEVHTFRAASMQEALDLVRRQLGADAVILNTRTITARGWLPWQKSTEGYEVTASLDVNVRPIQVHNRSTPRSNLAAPAKPPEAEPFAGLYSPADTGVSFERSTPPAETPANRAPSLAEELSRRASVSMPFGDNDDLVVASRTAVDPSVDFASRLDAIESMLGEIRRNSYPTKQADVPEELFQVYADLLEADVDDDTARDLALRLKERATAEQLANADAVQSLLADMIAADVRTAGPIQPQSGKRRVVALIGSTGVGKTTTLAKLAANFRLRDNVRVGLVTVDTYRIAAVEQLRTYAEIIDLPMNVVASADEMRRALSELSGLDLVLIDTAGRSPRDDERIRELQTVLEAADVDETHLVMNLSASPRTLRQTAEKFAAVRPTALIATKLDEVAGSGAILTAARTMGLPLSYVTTGQDVPDDIEVANSARIAGLVLGAETLVG